MGRDRKSHKRSRSVNPMMGAMDIPSDPLIGTDAQNTLEIINSNVERMFKSFTQKHQNKKNQVMEIYFTAANGDKERLNFLLQQPEAAAGVKFAKLTSSNTPLHKAAQYGHPVCCYMLVAAGANIDAANVNGETALHLAAMNNHIDVVEVLMQNGANPNLQTFDSGFTPLHFIATFGYDQCLIRMYSAIEKRDAAAHKKKLSTSAERSALPLYLNMTNFAGKAALHLVSEGRGALRKSNTHVGRILLEQGADVEVRDKDGFTPLHCAAYFGAYATCEMLLEFGASLTAKCKKGKRAVDVMLGDISPDLNLGLVEKKLLTQRMEALLCVPTSALSTNYSGVDISAVSAPRLRVSGLKHSHSVQTRLSDATEEKEEEGTLVLTQTKRKRSASSCESPQDSRKNPTPSSPSNARSKRRSLRSSGGTPKDAKPKKKFSQSKRQLAEAAVRQEARDEEKKAKEEDIRERTPVKTLDAPTTAIQTRHRRNSSLPQSSSDGFFKDPKMAEAIVAAALASVNNHSGRKRGKKKKKMKDVKEQQKMQREALKLLEKEDDKLAARQVQKMQHALAQELVLKVEYHPSLEPWVAGAKHRFLSFERSMTITDALEFVLQSFPGDAELDPADFMLFLPPTEKERRQNPTYTDEHKLLSSYSVQAKETVIMQTRASFESGQDLTKTIDWGSKKHKRSISWAKKKSFLSRSGAHGGAKLKSPARGSSTSESVQPAKTLSPNPLSKSGPLPNRVRKTMSMQPVSEPASAQRTSLDGLISRLGTQISNSSLSGSSSSLSGDEDDLVTISKSQLQSIIDTAVRLALLPVENELARAHNLQLQHSNARSHPIREIVNAEGLAPSDVPDLWYPDTLEELMTLQDSSDNFLPDIVSMERAKRLQSLLVHYSLDAPSDASMEDVHRILVDFLLYNAVQEHS